MLLVMTYNVLNFAGSTGRGRYSSFRAILDQYSPDREDAAAEVSMTRRSVSYWQFYYRSSDQTVTTDQRNHLYSGYDPDGSQPETFFRYI